MQFQLTNEFIEQVEVLIAKNDGDGLKALLHDLHFADVAEILHELDTDEATYIVKLLDSEITSEILIELDDDFRERILDQLTPSEIADELEIEVERVEKRLDPGPISRQHQLLAAFIPDRIREHPAERRRTLVTILFVLMDDDLGVAVRSKRVPAVDESWAQLRVVEDLAVIGDPHRLVFVRHRLMAMAEIDDAQPPVSERHASARVRTRVVRTAMLDHVAHSRDGRRIHSGSRVRECHTTYPAHQRVAFKKESSPPDTNCERGGSMMGSRGTVLEVSPPMQIPDRLDAAK